tara:strand:+ start:3899 stop:4207 length:309 start_codon:yes stop_codon:yes gene_type:complete
MGDHIKKLNIQQNLAKDEDMSVIKELFVNPKYSYNIKHIAYVLKDYILIAILYIIFSIHFVNNIFNCIAPITNGSEIILIVIKGIVFAIIFYILKNLTLAFK